MIGMKSYKVLAPAGESKFGEKLKDFSDTGEVIEMKVSLGVIEKLENGIRYRKPSYNGHTFSKSLRQGLRLQSETELFEIDFVNNEPRLSVVYMERLL